MLFSSLIELSLTIVVEVLFVYYLHLAPVVTGTLKSSKHCFLCARDDWWKRGNKSNKTNVL